MCGNTGIKFKDCENATVQNNLVTDVTDPGAFGISIESGSNHLVVNNTVDGCTNGLRIQSSGTIVNNIVTGNTIFGIKWGASSVENFNNAFGNGTNFDGPSPPGPNSISVDPLYATDLSGDGFFLSRPPDQGVTSPCVDTGDPAFSVNGTTNTSKLPDIDDPDMGFHYPLEQVKMTNFSLEKAVVSIDRKKDGTFQATYNFDCEFELAGGGFGSFDPDSHGIRVRVGIHSGTIPAGACKSKSKNVLNLTCKGKKAGVNSVKLNFDNGKCSVKVKKVQAVSDPLSNTVKLKLELGGNNGEDEINLVTGKLTGP